MMMGHRNIIQEKVMFPYGNMSCADTNKALRTQRVASFNTDFQYHSLVGGMVFDIHISADPVSEQTRSVNMKGTGPALKAAPLAGKAMLTELSGCQGWWGQAPAHSPM